MYLDTTPTDAIAKYYSPNSWLRNLKQHNNKSTSQQIEDSVYSENKSNSKALSLQQAYDLAKERGYNKSKKAFSNSFTRNKNESYQNFGISRVTQGAGKPALYYDHLC